MDWTATIATNAPFPFHLFSKKSLIQNRASFFPNLIIFGMVAAGPGKSFISISGSFIVFIWGHANKFERCIRGCDRYSRKGNLQGGDYKFPFFQGGLSFRAKHFRGVIIIRAAVKHFTRHSKVVYKTKKASLFMG